MIYLNKLLLVALVASGLNIPFACQLVAQDKPREVRMDFIVREITTFDAQSEGEVSVLSPRGSGVIVVPVLINCSDHPLVLISRGLRSVIRGRNVAYLWEVYSFEGHLVKESPSNFGLVTLKPDEATTLNSFELNRNDIRGSQYVVDYSVGDELRPGMEYWVGTVTGRISFKNDGSVNK
jgi:hypothetical protein